MKIRHLWRPCGRNTSTQSSSHHSFPHIYPLPSYYSIQSKNTPQIKKKPTTTPSQMASTINLFFTPINAVNNIPQRRAIVRTAATAAKTSGGSAEEKGILDFILGGLTKDDQFFETDPILKKVEEKGGSGIRRNTVEPPPQKKKDGGGFGLGGLFNKK